MVDMQRLIRGAACKIQPGRQMHEKDIQAINSLLWILM